MRPSYALALALLLMMTGCLAQLEDERDLCCRGCEGSITLHYRYIRERTDELDSFVRKMNHYLFDSEGRFVEELHSNPSSPQELKLYGLKQGRYQVLTIGNMGTSAELSPALQKGTTRLSEVKLSLVGHGDTPMSNTDELFWNTQAIEVSDEHCTQEYICDLANIHCHLFVTVEWRGTPKHEGKYTMELSNASRVYDLSPERAYSIDIMEGVAHHFPHPTSGVATHLIHTDLFDLGLEGEFITLRYFDNRIPTLRILYENDEVCVPIDLAKAFREWGWRINSRPEQIYRIRVTIFEDGSVSLTPYIEGAIEDWVDGGTLSIIRDDNS